MNIPSVAATPPSAAVQEARESAVQTKQEAARGDQQAARKLAASSAQKAERPSPPGTAQYVNIKA